MIPVIPAARFILSTCLFACAGTLRAAESGKSKPDVPPSVLQRYDRNKDGKLSIDEKARWDADRAARREKEQAKRAEMLAKYDANKDGKLSEEEKAAAKLELQKDRTEKDAVKMKERAAKEKAEMQAPGQVSPMSEEPMAGSSGQEDKAKPSSDKKTVDSPSMMME